MKTNLKRHPARNNNDPAAPGAESPLIKRLILLYELDLDSDSEGGPDLSDQQRRDLVKEMNALETVLLAGRTKDAEHAFVQMALALRRILFAEDSMKMDIKNAGGQLEESMKKSLEYIHEARQGVASAFDFIRTGGSPQRVDYFMEHGLDKSDFIFLPVKNETGDRT
jgi:hypothetical protein